MGMAKHEMLSKQTLLEILNVLLDHFLSFLFLQPKVKSGKKSDQTIPR